MSEDIKNKEELTKQNNGNMSLPRTIFSAEEIRNIVKSFVFAWMTGQIKIDFASRYEIIDREKESGREIGHDEAVKLELQYKNEITNLVEICSGIKKSTETELENSILKLFSKILDYKSSLRIEGSFMNYTIQDRLNELEEKIDVNSKVVEKLIKWLTDEASGNEKNMF